MEFFAQFMHSLLDKMYSSYLMQVCFNSIYICFKSILNKEMSLKIGIYANFLHFP